MSFKRKTTLLLLVFLLASFCLSFLQFSTPHIIGADGYYHIKFADLTKEQGLLTSFPWMYYTSWRENFADPHFLYHFFLIPFTFFGLTLGAKLSAVFFGALLFTIIYYFLRSFRIPHSWFWLLLLAILSPEFLSRLSLPRAPPVSLIFLFLGLLFILCKKPFFLFLTSFLYTLAYTASPILIVFYALYWLSCAFCKRTLPWLSSLSLFFGVLAGLLINPYFPQNLVIYKTQILNILFRPEAPQPLDIQPYPFSLFLALFWAVLALFLIAAFIFLKEKKLRNPRLLSLLFFSFLVLILTLRARQFMFYLVPLVVLTSALILSPLTSSFIKRIRSSRFRSLFLVLFILFFLLTTLTTSLKTINLNQHYSEMPGLHKIEGCAHWLEKNTPQKSIILHRWDTFPGLFFYNTHNYYLNAMDAAYIYFYDPIKHDLVNEIFFQGQLNNIHSTLRHLNSTTLVLHKPLEKPLTRLFQLKHRQLGLLKAYEDQGCVIYQSTPSSD